MIVSLSKKHSKGTEKPIGKITDCPEASMIKYPGSYVAGWVYISFGKHTICTTVEKWYNGPINEHLTSHINGDQFYLESPGTVVTFTQL